MVQRRGVVDGIPTNKTVKSYAITSNGNTIEMYGPKEHIIQNFNKQKNWEKLDEVLAEVKPESKEKRKERVIKNKKEKKEKFQQHLDDQKKKHEKQYRQQEPNISDEEKPSQQENEEEETGWTYVWSRSNRGSAYTSPKLTKKTLEGDVTIELGYSKRYMQSNLSNNGGGWKDRSIEREKRSKKKHMRDDCRLQVIA